MLSALYDRVTGKGKVHCMKQYVHRFLKRKEVVTTGKFTGSISRDVDEDDALPSEGMWKSPKENAADCYNFIQ